MYLCISSAARQSLLDVSLFRAIEECYRTVPKKLNNIETIDGIGLR